MKIKTKLGVTAFLPLGLVVLFGLIVLTTNRQISTLQQRRQVAVDLKLQVASLNSLAYYYLLHHEEQSAVQLKRVAASLGDVLSRIAPADPHEEAVVKSLRHDHDVVGHLTSALTALWKQGAPTPSSSRELQERLTGYVLERTREMTAETIRFESMTNAKLAAAHRRGNFLILTLGGLFSVIIFAALFVVTRRISTAIARLQEGTEVISSGNLEHRLAMRADDELGGFARSFDTMTERLQAVTVSKDRLQQEVEERKKAQKELHQNREWLRVTLASIGDAIIATDVDGKITFMNSVSEKITGWTFEEASSKPMTEVFHIINEHTREEVEGPITRVLREGTVVGLANHTILVRKDGSKLPIDDSGAPITDTDGNTMGVVLVFHDITERKQAEERAKHLASFPELNPAPILEADASGAITFCNSGALAILEDIGMDGADCERFLPEDFGDILRNWDKKSESTLHREILLKNRAFAETIHLVPQFHGARVYAFDITDRKLQEDRVARLTRLYAVLSKVNEAIVRTRDEESLFSGVCRTVAEVGNFPLAWIGLVEGQQVLPVASWPQEADYLKEIEVKLEGEPGRGPTGASIRENRPVINDDFATNPFTLPWHDAALRRGFHSSAAFPLRRQGKAVGSFTLYALEPGAFDAEHIALLESLSADVSYALDAMEIERLRVQTQQALRKAHDDLEKRVRERTAELTRAFDKLMQETKEREKLEAQLRQAQKMEALGTLTGGVAHDFNNILAAIIGFTELVTDHVPKESREAHHLKRVMESSLRGRELVRQMLTYSRKAEQEKKPLSLSTIVKETARLIRATTPTTISIMVSALGESGLVLADPTQIQQVIMNLCTNAAHAMREKGGTLDIRVSDHRVSASNENPHGINPGLYTKLTVRDTGAGMSPDIVDKIFDPFFTTKKLGEGTGLGLSVVHGIVKQSNGHITVESAPGEGSVFNVYFPQITGTGQLEADAVGDDMLPTGSERVLLIDDEEALVEMGEDILAELGYEVTSRMNGKEALALVTADPSRFDLVITDQTMPEMTGVELAQEILALKPDMPIIMCTGFSYVVDEDKAKAAGIRAFAMKPLTKKEIARTIRKVLDE